MSELEELEMARKDKQALHKLLNTAGEIISDRVSERDKWKARAEVAERKLAERLASNNHWWEQRFEYFHRWAKTLPEPHITEFFDIAANGRVAEWRERYKEILAQIEQPQEPGK